MKLNTPSFYLQMLIPGKLYNFKFYTKDDKKNNTYVGIFIKYLHISYDDPSCIFECLGHTTQISILASQLKFVMNTDPIFAKQFARGLCDRIPEDCAGIIERMIVGDKVVRKGPDRYAERN